MEFTETVWGQHSSSSAGDTKGYSGLNTVWKDSSGISEQTEWEARAKQSRWFQVVCTEHLHDRHAISWAAVLYGEHQGAQEGYVGDVC